MNRRTILRTTGSIALAGLAAGGHAAAQTDLPVEISQNPEEEFVTIANTGDEDLDLTGYRINFDAEEGNDQTREIAGDVVIPAGDEITIATGGQTTADTDYELTDPYDGYVLNNAGTDLVALLDPEGNAVVSGDETSTDEPDSGGGEDGAGSDEDDASENDGDNGDDTDNNTGEDSSADDETNNEADDSESESEYSAATDDGSSDSDAKKDCPDEMNSEDTTDADNDGVVASEDADDNCAKIS